MTKVKFSNHIRAVSDDKRPLVSEIESIAASMNHLSGPDKRKIVAAFADAGLLSGSVVNAAAVDDRGRYDANAISSALKAFPIETRIALKNILVHKGLLK